ncbi:uncharacterized protein [Procambarus clarkii]|uniref:uncharacterized protein n=1 Tax=Procambarus clarkii TaxID=6728 RepID=UPI00374217C6
MTSEKRYAVVGFNDRSVGIISTTWIEKSDDEKILCWWPQSRHTVSAQKHEKPDTTNWRVHVVSTILSTTDDFDVAKRRCLAAEDTSNVETEDDMGYPRQRKRKPCFKYEEENSENNKQSSINAHPQVKVEDVTFQISEVLKHAPNRPDGSRYKVNEESNRKPIFVKD